MAKTKTQVYKLIESLNPCASRWNNYVRHYKKFNGSYEEFILLDKITFEDKVWVLSEIMEAEVLQRWAEYVHTLVRGQQRVADFYLSTAETRNNMRGLIVLVTNGPFDSRATINAKKKKILRAAMRFINEGDKAKKEDKKVRKSLQEAVDPLKEYALAG